MLRLKRKPVLHAHLSDVTHTHTHTHTNAYSPPPPNYTHAHAASEISEIRNAVSSLKASLEAMRTNTEPADAKILMLNLKVGTGCLMTF